MQICITSPSCYARTCLYLDGISDAEKLTLVTADEVALKVQACYHEAAGDSCRSLDGMWVCVPLLWAAEKLF